MKKLFLSAFIGLVACTFSAKAQTLVTPNPSAAEIKFETEAHDFGTFKQGGNGTYEFVFKNTGKEPLIISNAQGSCGCTVPEWPKEPIKPGQSNRIKVTYDTQRVGGFTKTVTLTTNAKTPSTVLTIKGLIEEKPKEITTPFKDMEKSGAPVENKEHPNN